MKGWLTNRWVHTLLLLSVLAGAGYERMNDHDWVKSMRYFAFDSYNRFHPRAQTEDVVIVDIDEESLRDDKLGQWPWPRTTVAQLVGDLKGMGAKAIVFDMVFAETDRTSPSVLLKRLPENALSPEFASELGSLPDHDDTLAKAIAAAGNVVTGFAWAEGGIDTPLLKKPIRFGKDADQIKKTVTGTPGITATLPVLENAAAGNGTFGLEASFDGVIRQPPLFVRKTGEGATNDIYPALSIEGLRVAQDPRHMFKIAKTDLADADLFAPAYMLTIGKYQVPLEKDGQFYVHYSKARPEKYIPAWKVLDDLVKPDAVAGKIVLVGTSAIGLKDLRSTPVNFFIPGVEVHLNVIEQIMQGRFLQRPEVVQGAELIFTMMVGLLIILLAPFFNPVILTALTVSLIAVMAYVSLWAFDTQGLLLDPVYPSLTIFMLSVAAALLTYVRTEAERRAVRQAFGLYISPDYMKELTNNPDQLRLGGELRDITVMFTDIRGFTSISEQLKPDELIQMMNDFLTPMSDIVMSNRGTIDKYMGDAMMAFWNAPLTDEEHQRNACIAALAMNEALQPINARLIAEAEGTGKKPLLLKAGIGVNSGPGAVGNMGSKQRFAYSVMGDTVNLASRLEGQTKAYGVDVLIGEATASAVPDFALLELDLIRVKGKLQPVRIFTLLGNQEEAQKSEFHLLQLAHKKMLSLYRDREFKAALDSLQDCLAHTPASIAGYYEMMRERITEMQKTPPDESWDGVFVAQSK